MIEARKNNVIDCIINYSQIHNIKSFVVSDGFIKRVNWKSKKINYDLDGNYCTLESGKGGQLHLNKYKYLNKRMFDEEIAYYSSFNIPYKNTINGKLMNDMSNKERN